MRLVNLLKISFVIIFLGIHCKPQYACLSTNYEIPEHIIISDRMSRMDLLIDAIAWVESRNNDTCINRRTNAVGYLQLTEIYVTDVNRIIGVDTYTLDDALDRQKSIEMFIIIQKHYNRKLNPIAACRLHNPKAGPDYTNQIIFRYLTSLSCKPTTKNKD